AIFSGLLKTSKEYIEEIIVSNRSNVEKIKQLQHRYNVSTETDWKQHVTSVDTVVLAMTPSAHEELLDEISPLISKQ
ncbi:NAD(P)-binding domain-containing protein, partial [Bacillus thuringiensis]|nr:NAD(P)-binding domain-containing protein [Bacillus thuringiensis]